MTLRMRVLKTNPSTLILSSFLLVIAAGAAILSLGVSTKNGRLPLADALFTSTSAVCVTGLVVVDTGSCFSTFGQIVILFLIQIGGLGVMTLSVAFFRFFGRSVSFKQRMIMQDLFSPAPTEDIFGIVKSILFFTFGAELLGAGLLALRWSRDMPVAEAIYAGIFHSVSAFCNAGFSLFSDSFVRYAGDPATNVIICILIVTGGIGFPVLYELRKAVFELNGRNRRLSVQTKTVLATTALLIAGGAILFAFLERDSLAKIDSVSARILVPIFQSVTSRTAGFNTADIGALGDAALAFIIFLMFVGASPGSCGGGVKTTTLALLWAFAASRIKRMRRVTMFRRSIPEDAVDRSVALVVIATGLLALVVFMLLQGGLAASGTGQERRTFLALLFETVSAFGTVGLSTGVTPFLSTWGKAWIILTMIIGRVGVLSFSYVFIRDRSSNGAVYSEEKIMIG